MMQHIKKSISSIAVLSIIFALTGCVGMNFNLGRGQFGTVSVQGTGEMTSAEHEVGAYGSVDIRGLMKVVYSASPSSKVKLEIQENLRQYVSFRVEGETLVVDCERNFMTLPDKTPVLFLYNPNLRAIYASGAISMKDSEPIKGDSFLLDVAGGGDVDLTLDVNKLEIDISGAGSIRLDGSAKDASIRISGAGNIEALELYTQSARISLSGAGSASISCSDDLDASMSGAGSLRYRGSPTVNKRISGAGSIQQVR